MSIKMLREDLCRWQVFQSDWPPSIASAVDVLIAMIDKHRPLGNDGKHGDLHTPTCGCEGVKEPHTYECFGCGETFTFRHIADISFDGQVCPNRCGNVLSPAT